MENTAMITVTIRIPVEWMDEVRDTAEERWTPYKSVSHSEIIREALYEWLERRRAQL